MRYLEITDTETARERALGMDVAGWTLRRLQGAGFDIATEIVYHYTAAPSGVSSHGSGTDAATRQRDMDGDGCATWGKIGRGTHDAGGTGQSVVVCAGGTDASPFTRRRHGQRCSCNT